MYSEALPIEAGRLQLYRDGAYVGEADTPAFLPGAQVRMPFGVDERLHVTIRDEATQSGEKGLLGRQTSKETRQRIDITNHHPVAMAVEVVDRVPVSKNEDVHRGGGTSVLALDAGRGRRPDGPHQNVIGGYCGGRGSDARAGYSG